MKFKFFLVALLSFLLAASADAQKKVAKPPTKKTTVSKKVTAKKPAPKLAAKKPAVPLPVKSTERLVEISTNYGTMVARLYDSTPLHRDNFIKLVEQGFYDSLLFHRVIESFMIQGGDPTSKYVTDSVQVGSGAAPGDRIPAEFKPFLFHKKGALAAARDNNPAKASSNCQFYIVQGRKFAASELDNVITQRILPEHPDFKYTATQREIYERVGGAPFLDQGYTVFGEVISGLDVIDKIAKAPKGPNDRPLENVRMKIRMLN